MLYYYWQEADIVVHKYFVTQTRYSAFDFVIISSDPSTILIPATTEDYKLFACSKPFQMEVTSKLKKNVIQVLIESSYYFKGLDWRSDSTHHTSVYYLDMRTKSSSLSSQLLWNFFETDLLIRLQRFGVSKYAIHVQFMLHN